MAEGNFLKRRRVPRRPFLTKVGILFRGEYMLGESFEIGERGMLLTSQFDLKSEDFCVVSFILPGLFIAVVRGCVRYSKVIEGRPAFGIEFENLDFVFRRRIRQFVAQRTSGTLIDELDQ